MNKQQQLLEYILSYADKSVDDWEDFYSPTSEMLSDYSKKFQLAFPLYALALYVFKYGDTDEWIKRLMTGLIDKMLDKKVWKYWSNIHLNPDPVIEGNIMYSGHLLLMTTLFTYLFKGSKYEKELILRLNEETSFDYDIHQLAKLIKDQMEGNHHHGVACQFGFVFIMCTNIGALGLKLYDKIYDTDYSVVTKKWLNWTKENFIQQNPLNGIFHEYYYSQFKLMDRFSFVEIDAANLFTLYPLDSTFAKELYPIFKNYAVEEKGNTIELKHELLAKVLNKTLGILDETFTYGFVYLLTREIGDTQLANQIRKRILEKYPITHEENLSYFGTVKSPLLFTSMFLLGELMETEGEFSKIFEL